MLEIGGMAAVKSIEMAMAPFLLRSPSGDQLGGDLQHPEYPIYKYGVRVKCVGGRDQAQEHNGHFPLPRTRSP